MKKKLFLPLFIIFILLISVSGYIFLRNSKANELRKEVSAYSGSESCRPCHEEFYQLWHDSHHGLAMQPVNNEFIENNIKSFETGIRVGESMFSVSKVADTLMFTEINRLGESTDYPAVHTMGGKYIYFFLTPFSRGRLQVLPLAYDCNTDAWYNNPESGVRHFEDIEDAPLDWKNHLYTFNTTCYNCHVSQLETNYNLEQNTYNTTWREPGINCETCHGPSYEHIVECVKAGEGNIPEDLKIVMTSSYSAEQHNSACGSCHAKASVIAESFEPGELFYDNFDLITIENPDFYADGRDLGENYTMTSWEMNSCAEKSGMHCVSCHTSSGRYRFSGENANDACMPCHSDKVNNVSSHTFHKPDSEGSRCISCHMPKTTFARMDRSDHSFRPPVPRATIAFGSPNACNICHTDKSAEWADVEIQKTHNREYQDELVRNGQLIRMARANDWSSLDEILSGLEEGRFDKVFSASFIRLLENCNDPAKWRVMLKMTKHSSPLVRGAAAHSLYLNNSQDSFDRLCELIKDEFRVVRLNAAFSISNFSQAFINDSNRASIETALKEYEESLITNPDDWSAHYNLGNYYSNLNEFDKAIAAYNNSMRIYPEAIMPMVNAGFVYSLQGEYNRAEELFTRALSYNPDHEAALLNLALLYGETGNNDLAKEYFTRLLDISESNAVAAYNLAILESENDIQRSVELSRKASEWEPDNQKYAYTYSFFLASAGMKKKAVDILESLINSDPAYFDAFFLIADIFVTEGDTARAIAAIEKGLGKDEFNNSRKQALGNRLEQLK